MQNNKEKDPFNTKNICCNNKVPTNFNSPFYETKMASNIVNDEYGNIKDISYSSMRQNYTERMKHIMEDTTNDFGLSTGGGEYVVPIYKHRFEEFHRPNCFDFGYQTLKNAYWKENEGRCKIHYEDY